MPTSPNAFVDKKKIRSGLYIYKTGRSPNWYVQHWDITAKKYARRSTFETGKIEATRAAIEFSDTYRSTVNPLLAATKNDSFENYAKRFDQHLRDTNAPGSRKYDDYHKTLFRPNDGLISYFGRYDISKITTGMLRDYLAHLDAQRDKPLAGGSKKKQIMVIRAVLRMAMDDNALDRVPDAPKIASEDKPRVAFNQSTYRRFIKALHACAERGDVVHGEKISGHHIKMFRFIVHSFVRPTQGELFELRHEDIAIKVDPPRLELVVRKGKTGLRQSFTMPFAVAIYQGVVGHYDAKPDPKAYVFLPRFEKRDYARAVAARIFRHAIKEAGLDKEREPLTTYSLRHYALQKRVQDSKSKVDRNLLAKNAGTSVEMLERFYLSRMQPSPEVIKQFQSND